MLSLLALAACTAPSTSSESQALSSFVENGSFETGDYTGWTLRGSTWGIAADGQTIQRGDNVFDFVEQGLVAQFSPALPITYHATDGSFVALQLQTFAEDRRMFQTVSLPSCQPLLQWDMQYQVFGGSFDPNSQYIAVNIRDPETDAVLATPFKTSDGDPTTVPTMTPFQIDLSAFAGQTVELDFEQQVEIWHFPSAYDNIRIVCKGLGAVPGSIDFGLVPVNTASPPVATTITNFADVPLTMTSMSIDPPFFMFGAPAFPFELQPGQSTQVFIAFFASFAGPATDSLVITSDDPNGPITVPLAAEGTFAAPRLTITPSVDFGTVRVGTTSATQLVHIENDGDFPATIDSLQLLSLTFGMTVPNLPIVLPPGASIDVPVTFSPAFEAPDSTQLTFFSAGMPLPTTLFGVGVAPHITTFPPSLDFGSHPPETLTLQSLTVMNSGTDVLSLGTIVASPPFGVDGSLPTFLLPGDSVTINIAFAPVAPGVFVGSVSIPSDDPDVSVLTIPTSGVGAAPDVAVSPTSLDFGSVPVSTTSTAQPVTITNPGSDTLVITSLEVTGPFAASMSGDVFVPPGESTTVAVTFSPFASGSAVGTLFISTNAPAGVMIVELAGTGNAAILSVDTASIDFGSQRVATTGTKTFTVSNVGTSPLVVGLGAIAPPFSVAPVGSLVVLPGGHASFVVSFTPTTTGLASGTVEISSDAGGAEVAIAGTGVQPLVSVTPPAHDFGDVRVGATSASLVSITNPGTDTLHVTAVTFPPAFSPMPALRFPVAVAPGSAMSFNIVFAPGHAAYSSSIAVATDAGPASFAVTGRGVAPTLVASLDTLPFGPVAIGTTASLSVQLANTGDAPATVSTISVIGSPEFSIVPLSLPAVVPASGSMTVSVAFSPTDHGLRSAKVVVASDAPAVSIAVAGTGSGARAVVAPGSLDLGAANVGSPTASRGVTVSNTGDVGLVISAIVVAGPAASDFTSTTTLPITV
ncbi:MAG TPA: choice-of-anchor D domain-containing protein, partial [Kofleriaceae bacterium]|nr:choice-of-anchor D domain-containing protein [Kofleriaceae bacterium]